MKINKITTILSLIFVSLFLLTACGQQGDSSTGLSEYRIGSQGLELDFLPNSPPRVVYAEDGSFPITIEVKNKGVFPGEGDGTLNANLYYIGFDNAIITNLNTESITFAEEEAKTRFNPEGGITIVNSEANLDAAFFTSAKIDNYDANIVVALCYPYKTYASIDVCVDPNPNRDSSLDTCTPGVSGTGSQGAPVAVSSVDSISQKGKARFVIDISNVGGGNVIKESELSRCTDVELEREDLDKIAITSASLSNGIPVTCTPSGEASLINGRATVVCKAEGLDDTMPAFETVLQVELSYGYKKTIQQVVQVQGE